MSMFARTPQNGNRFFSARSIANNFVNKGNDMPVSRHNPASRRWLRQSMLCALVVVALLFLGEWRVTNSARALAQSGDTPHATNVLNTTLDDFFLPGSQPLGLTTPLVANCTGCH